MPVTIAHTLRLPFRPARAAYCGGLATLLVLLANNSLQTATANGDTRTLSIHHTHTKEDLTVTYKKNGRYDEEALKKINWILRDWRTDQPTKINPHLLDIVWEVHREVGGREPINIISAYRSPATNAMLRRRSSGVAKFSQHMLGNAMDFFIPNIPLEEIRHAGLRLQRGGVGFYPTSGSPFVHLDTGNVRHWPRMPEQQLARVMAKGPLTRVASVTLPNPFAKLFGGGKDEDEDNQDATAASTAPAPSRTRSAAVASRTAATEPTAEKPTIVAAAVPLPPTRPGAKPAAGFDLASATSKPVEVRPASQASLVALASDSANDIINERGFWQGLQDPADARQTSIARASNAPRPPADIPVVASAETQTTGSIAPWPMPERSEHATAGALAYAPALGTPVGPVRAAAPMGIGLTRSTPAPQPDTTVAVKRSGDRPSTIIGGPPSITGKTAEKLNNPWMRAMILSPDAQNFMSTALMGATDYRHLAPYLHKPAASVMMTFSADPHLGMSTDQFRGSAVVFVSTVTFNHRTAALR